MVEMSHRRYREAVDFRFFSQNVVRARRKSVRRLAVRTGDEYATDFMEAEVGRFESL